MRIRPWQSKDLAAAVAIVKLTHDRDAYPVLWPPDPGAFVAPGDCLGAWSAESSTGALIGAVRLRPAHGPPLPLWTAGTGRPGHRLGVVSRLFVAPVARRDGTGRALLAIAAEGARERGLVPVLDVLVRYDAARRLYEAEGWERLGQFIWPMPDGSEEPSYAYWFRRPEVVRD